MSEKRIESNLDQNQGQESSPIQLARLYPADRGSADLFRNSLLSFDVPPTNTVRDILDRKNSFKLVDGRNQEKKEGDPKGKEERSTLNVGSIVDFLTPKGFDRVDQKKVDAEFDAANSKNKNAVLEHHDKDKHDARLTVTSFGYFVQQPEAVKAYNDLLNGVKKEDLGKTFELNEKQMDTIFPIMPNGLDPRQQVDHKFSVQEIDGRRVLVTENKIQSFDGDEKKDKMKLTVYANPDQKKETMDVISFEASSRNRAKPGDNNYANLKPEALRTINSIKWAKDPKAAEGKGEDGDKKSPKKEEKKEEKKEAKQEEKTVTQKKGEEIKANVGTDKWTIKDGVATRTVDAKASNDRKPSTLKDATIDAQGNLTGKGEIVGAHGKKETAVITVKPDGSWSEARTGHDTTGKSYNFTVSRDKSGFPTHVEHPVIKDGKLYGTKSRSFDFQYQKDKGELVLKDGKPVLERVNIKTSEQGKDDINRSLVKQADGQWRFTEPVLDYASKKVKDADAPGPDGKPKQQIWPANPAVAQDGSLVHKEQDKSGHVFKPDGEQSTFNLGKTPKTSQEKAAADDRTKIFSIHEDKNKKHVWAQGVPSVINQWGFDSKDDGKQIPGPTNRDPERPKWQKLMGDQGYPYWRRQDVDAQGVKSRDTWFGREGGVRIPYTGPDGELHTLNNVQRMTSERQADGSYKVSYLGADGKPVAGGDGKPAIFNTTADGRYIEDTGAPAEDRISIKPVAKDTTQQKASQTVKISDLAGNIPGLENMARGIDLNKDPQGADQVARLLIEAKMKDLQGKLGQARQDNDGRAIKEQSRTIYELQYMNESAARRREFLETNYR